jgi:hypothetical protein
MVEDAWNARGDERLVPVVDVSDGRLYLFETAKPRL